MRLGACLGFCFPCFLSFLFVLLLFVSFVSSFFPLYLARERVHRVKKSTLKPDACVWSQGPTWWKEKNDPFLAVLWPLRTPSGKCTCSHIHRLFFFSFFFLLESKRLGTYLIVDPEFNHQWCQKKKKKEENIRAPPHLPFSLEGKVGEICIFQT